MRAALSANSTDFVRFRVYWFILSNKHSLFSRSCDINTAGGIRYNRKTENPKDNVCTQSLGFACKSLLGLYRHQLPSTRTRKDLNHITVQNI